MSEETLEAVTKARSAIMTAKITTGKHGSR